MKKAPKNKGKRILAVLLGIIWAILVVIAVYDVVEIYTYNPFYVTGADYTAKKVLSKDYGGIYYSIHNDVTQDFDFEERTEYTELKAMHDYIEAAAQYRMYKENSLSDKAEYYKAKMDEAKTRFGELDFTVKDIDQMLGIE